MLQRRGSISSDGLLLRPAATDNTAYDAPRAIDIARDIAIARAARTLPRSVTMSVWRCDAATSTKWEPLWRENAMFAWADDM